MIPDHPVSYGFLSRDTGVTQNGANPILSETTV